MTSVLFPLTFPIEFGDTYDHILTRLKNRFTTPYWTEDEGNIDKLMQLYAEPLAEIADTEDDILASHQLQNATGNSLDRWGNLLQLIRNTSEADDLYRARLMTQILIYRRSATPQDMVSTCAEIIGVGTDKIVFTDGASPASFGIEAFLADVLASGITFSDLCNIIDDAKAGGVDMSLTMLGTFICRGIGDASDNTKGYDNIAHANPDGGLYSGVV